MCLYFHFCSQVSLLRSSSRVHTKMNRSRGIIKLRSTSRGPLHFNDCGCIYSVKLRISHCQMFTIDCWWVTMIMVTINVCWQCWRVKQSVESDVRERLWRWFTEDEDEDHQKCHDIIMLCCHPQGQGWGLGPSHTCWWLTPPSPGVTSRGNTLCCPRSWFGCD